ncbi:hypothetical protein IP84_17140 [beta proteobacterium AAP99]|nr:hypothetical protein IP84_17140 [beta proteobacterium AAP99]
MPVRGCDRPRDHDGSGARRCAELRCSTALCEADPARRRTAAANAAGGPRLSGRPGWTSECLSRHQADRPCGRAIRELDVGPDRARTCLR